MPMAIYLATYLPIQLSIYLSYPILPYPTLSYLYMYTYWNIIDIANQASDRNLSSGPVWHGCHRRFNVFGPDIFKVKDVINCWTYPDCYIYVCKFHYFLSHDVCLSNKELEQYLS